MALPPAPPLPSGASSALPAIVGITGARDQKTAVRNGGEGIWLSGVEMAWRGICVTCEPTLLPAEAASDAQAPADRRSPGPWAHTPTHLISSAEKLTMVGMKFSLMMMERICFQSVVLSPSSRQMDSSASFTAAGGLAMDRTSTRCCFLMDFTAGHEGVAVRGARPQPRCDSQQRGARAQES